MQTRNRNTFTTIHTEGALLPVDLLQRISENDSKLEGLDAVSYNLAPGEKLNEAINRSWNRLNGLWGAFQSARGRLGANEAGTTLTRERWLLPLFQELGFGRLSTTKAVEIDGKSYPISHRWQNVPLHLVGCGLKLDKHTPGAAGASRTSPHSLLQEYLNQSEDAQWGMVSNGLGLRVLRDNATLTRQAYIEFDLESMFDGEVYSDFVLLWLVCHQSRFEPPSEGGDCILERWSKSAQERGTRALDNLRRGVEEAIVSLGQGFLQHPLNQELRARLRNGDLSAQDYYRQLLRLVYRLIFLFAAEDRDLLLLPDAPIEARKRYLDFYSTARLRSLAERQRGSRHHDRYEALRIVFSLLSGEEISRQDAKDAKISLQNKESFANFAPLREALALPALGGFLFDARSTPDLNEARLDNKALLAAVRSLAFITEGNTRRAVDYRNLGPEELGSVYESLLELYPLLNTDAGTFQLTSAAGNERKTTGSYYTPSSLIQVLLDSALYPVINQAMEDIHREGAKSAKETDKKENLASFAALRENALLSLKVCDPACGSGHFLIAAAHRIAGKLAQVRAGGDEPSPNETRRALRDVIRHCIYGVDINPMAVELCKVNLWLESLEPGKPLSFLDAHIRCGNSLVGVGPRIHRQDAKGSLDEKDDFATFAPLRFDDLVIPDEAFNPVTGDHKPTATLLKKRNLQERAGQESFFVSVIKTREDLDKWLAERTRTLEAMPEDSAAEVQAKAEAYQKVNDSTEYRKQQQIADLWTAAFFWNIQEPSGKTFETVAPTHGQLRRLRNGSQTQSGLLEHVDNIRQQVGFFHWPLEFAEVAVQGGFDCVLGNPPWERIKLQEEEFFASRDPEIAAAVNKATRQKLINALGKTNLVLATAFNDAKHYADAASKFMRASRHYPLTGAGDVNTYALFAELNRKLLSTNGFAGLVLPTGIATDDMTKSYFGDIVAKKSLVSIFDFENRENLFSSIDSRMKFCLFTVSNTEHAKAEFVFFAKRSSHLRDSYRRFSLGANEIALFNPNTRTVPIFRTSADADLARKIYSNIPILENEVLGTNTWQIKLLRMFDMAADSKLFSDSESNVTYPLYESKMMAAYDHRFANVVFNPENKFRPGQPQETSTQNHLDPNFRPKSQWYVPKQNVHAVFQRIPPKWFISFKRIVGVTNERTLSATILPLCAVSDSLVEILSLEPIEKQAYFLANLNSLVLDYIVRLKVSATTINHFVIKQFPVLLPSSYTPADFAFIVPRVLELVYTAYDLQPFAEDMGYHGEPFRWDEERRAMLRAELDAYYARLYGLTRDELRYILDPQDVYGPDFPGETFRVLKEKEFRQFGEYRTRRLVLEAWDRLEGVETGNPLGYREQAVPLEPKQDTIHITQPKPESQSAVIQEKLSTPVKKEVDAAEGQSMLSDFGLYKCESCGKMVIGFEKGNHVQEEHGGKSVEWRKIK